MSLFRKKNDDEQPKVSPCDAGVLNDDDEVVSYTCREGHTHTVPREVNTVRNRLTVRENHIMNCIGIMARLDHENHGDEAQSIFGMLTYFGVSNEEWERLCDTYNMVVDVITASNNHDAFEVTGLIADE
jgi:hypothetical protein